ncbi:MAG: UDP-3-O-(3-hydroxymyristoyl)glucosamine N-acyltransferase [Deltaproteobacteria bacterium]|nr:UDP-3-O-(3-hydroxymyristoyl)glucosamine N-acyltransferase [Deltaproteobacteria bacterium]
MGRTLKEIAAYLNAELLGDETVAITDIKGIEEAGPGDITFISNPKYRKQLETTAASAVLAPPGIVNPRINLLILPDPYSAVAKLLALFYPEEAHPGHISEKALIEEGAVVSSHAHIDPGVYISCGARIERGAVLYPGVFVGAGAVIGEDSVLYPNVSIYRRCIIGKRVILHAGVVIGADGFGFTRPGVENLKFPQIGIVQIDDDVEVGANSTIDRGALNKTWIQRGVKIDNLVQVGHNVVIGEDTVIAAQVGIAGSTKIGRGVIIGGQAGFAGHITIGDHVMVAGQSGVHEDVPPNQVVSGTPHLPHREWLRAASCFPRLPEMRKNVGSLTKRLETLENVVHNIKKDK